MNILTPYSKRLAGFSLVEMAIVILIAGIMMGAGLSLLAVKQAAAQFDVTQKHQETIKQALINYLGKNKRLPCPVDPASPTTGIEGRSATATLPPCFKYSGVVPYAELGLDRAAALDGWENFIDYVVSPPTTHWLYTYGAPASTTLADAASAFWPSNNAGSITAKVNGTDINIVASLISHGKNGLGAINIKGIKNLPLPTGTDELQNTNPISGALSNTVIKRDATDSTSGGGAFDDVVMMLSANDLTGPLIANGTLQSSAQQALNQANAIVLGKIIASKGNCTPCKFTIPNTGSITFPASVIEWNVVYVRGTTSPCPSSPSSQCQIDSGDSSNDSAYTLTAGDGTPPRAVSFTELIGILGSAVGFN